MAHPCDTSEAWAEARLGALAADGKRRHLRELSAAGGCFTGTDGRVWLNLASNDYLDLAQDADVRAAASDAAASHGAGSTASRLVAGTLPLHSALEAELADLMGRPAARVFGSGYLANLGVLDALGDRGSQVFGDRLNHASLIDGTRLAGARLHRYRHNDPDHLVRLLRRYPVAAGRHPIIVTDSVFSMDGDTAPLADIAQIAEDFDAFWIVDEAHALGVLGPNGAGLCACQGVTPTVITGGFGKAMGGYGGYAVTGEALANYLDNAARSFIYATALPPASVAGVRTALTKARRAQGALGGELLARTRRLRDGLAARGLAVPDAVASPILPVTIGGNEAALAVSQALRDDAILCQAMRPPTVPAGTARLRASVTLAHSREALDDAATAIATAAGSQPAEAAP